MIVGAFHLTAYVVDALRVMRERRLSGIEALPEVEGRHTQWVCDDLEETVWVENMEWRVAREE